MNKWFDPTVYWVRDYLSMLGLKLIRASKRDPSNVTDVIGGIKS